jgi:hypothetical protein
MSTITFSPFKENTSAAGQFSLDSDVILVGDVFYNNMSEGSVGIPGWTAELIIADTPSTATLRVYPGPGRPVGLITGNVTLDFLTSDAFYIGELPIDIPVSLAFSVDVSVYVPPVSNLPVSPATSTTLASNALFLEYEKSAVNEPIDAYEFSYGGVGFEEGLLFYRYTSGNFLVKINGNVYAPELIRRSELRQTTDISKGQLTLTVSKNNDIAKMFIAGTPSTVIFVRSYRGFVNKNGDYDFIVQYHGRVSACSFTGFEASIDCDSLYVSIKRLGLRQYYETSCCHALYDMSSCKLARSTKANLVMDYTLNSYRNSLEIRDAGVVAQPAETTARQAGTNLLNPVLDGTTGEVVSSGTGWFTGGMLELPDKTLHMVSSHTKESGVVVIHLVRSIPVAQLVEGNLKIYPGCDHTTVTCSKLGNILNFGGFPWLTPSNPFEGTHVPMG